MGDNSLVIRKQILNILASLAIFLLITNYCSATENTAEIVEEKTNLELKKENITHKLEQEQEELKKTQNKQIQQDLQEITKLSSKLQLLSTERKNILDEIEQGLKEISAITLGSKSSTAELEFFYEKATLYWRILADSSLKLFSANGDLNYDRPESLNNKEFAEIDPEKISKLQNNYQKLLKNRNSFIEEIKNI